MIYNKGEGVTRNPKQAMYWYQKAAEQDFVNAQLLLRKMYYKSEGVALDKKQAVYWWQKAAEQGNENAKELLRQLQ